MIARLIADYLENPDPDREGAWVAELDGERVGLGTVAQELWLDL
jgi:hypothetical protein